MWRRKQFHIRGLCLPDHWFADSDTAGLHRKRREHHASDVAAGTACEHHANFNCPNSINDASAEQRHDNRDCTAVFKLRHYHYRYHAIDWQWLWHNERNFSCNVATSDNIATNADDDVATSPAQLSYPAHTAHTAHTAPRCGR